MVLTRQEESLIGIVRMLPASEAQKVFSWAQELSRLANGGPIQWSDSWTEEDLTEATRAAMERSENSKREGL